ncbi:MAG: acyl-CoA dehydrogenase family protein [Candidatus Accumulibacter sp.]|jgi:alkylation response protein AidB-like acyl-CoA dehydrogenase|nr:acyl-CoA dehydrogenase family protein [Accumulibacter sp.]
MEARSAKIREWLLTEVAPQSNRCEDNQQMPDAILRRLAELGLTGACVPAAYGGLAADSLTLGAWSALLARANCSLLSIFVVHAMLAQALARFGDETQKQALLPLLAEGRLRGAFALTEPEIGSDASAIACSARRVAGAASGFVLNGRKKWISGACYADLFMVLARLENEEGTSEGVVALLVPAATPGLTVTPMRNLLGFRAAGIAELSFEHCLIPARLPFQGAPAALLGPIGGGFSFVASHALDTGRFVVGWAGVGVMEGCLEAAAAYARERVQFGQALRKHQLILEMIADMATDLAAARALAEKAARDREAAGPDSILSVTMSKYFSSRASVRVAASALQLHGGNGCAAEFPLQRYFRDSKILEIIEGSSQMQQLMISSAALTRGRRTKSGKSAGKSDGQNA